MVSPAATFQARTWASPAQWRANAGSGGDGPVRSQAQGTGDAVVFVAADPLAWLEPSVEVGGWNSPQALGGNGLAKKSHSHKPPSVSDRSARLRSTRPRRRFDPKPTVANAIRVPRAARNVVPDTRGSDSAGPYAGSNCLTRLDLDDGSWTRPMDTICISARVAVASLLLLASKFHRPDC